MATLRYSCRICKAVKDHTNITEFENLPPGVLVVECLGCGVMGVQLVDNEEVIRNVNL
jgi:hypothetical protein